MATKNYMINDKWLDIDKQNIVELQSVDGVLDSLKVNGSEVVTPSGKITITENGTDIDIAQYALADVNVEGGGGSSDFSTAEVTMNSVNFMPLPYLKDGDLVYEYPEDTGVYTVPIPSSNGGLIITLDRNLPITAEGFASVEHIWGQTTVTITGDCSLTCDD